MRQHTRATRRHGFTLVEIIIVVAILGILAAIIVPRYTSATGEAKASATAVIVSAVNKKVAEYYAQHGEYPEEIDMTWFAGGTIYSPYVPEDNNPITYYDGDLDAYHPSSKYSAIYTFWYNPATGSFRACVDVQATEEETVALYNRVNGTGITDLGQMTQ